MCMIDSADYPDFVRVHSRVARTTHCCSECARIIAQGETYEYVAGKSDGEFFQNKTCAHCQKARVWLSHVCRGWVYGGMLQDLAEHWDYEPRYRSRWLAQALWGMKHKWTRKGGVMPLLSDPPVTTDGLPASSTACETHTR